MKKLLFLLLITANVINSQTITNVRVTNILGSDAFEGDTPWVNFDTPGYNFGFNNQLGGINSYSWSRAWGGAAINSGASASGGSQSMQIHWGGIVPIQGFIYNSSKIYKFEVMVHPPSGNDGTWNNWGAVHLFCSNNSNLWQTTGLRIRLTNGGPGGNPNRLAIDLWEGESGTYRFVEVKDFSANPNDYLVDGTSGKYWIPLMIEFTGAGNATNPLKVDFYLNQTFVGSQSFNNLAGLGDNLIGLSQNGNDGDVAKFDNVKISELASNIVNINSDTNSSSLVNCSSCDVTIKNSSRLLIDQTTNFNSITVNPGGKLTLNSARFLTATSLTLLSDATGTGTFVDNNANGGLTVSGTSTVNQSLQAASALRTWYITPPVASATPTPTLSIIKYFDETINSGTATDNWVSTSSMVAKKGYQVVPVAGNDISFSGTLNNGNQNITLTSRTLPGNFDGFNLIGNPYPSYLDWSLVTAANTTQMRSTTMWYRTKKLNLSSQLVYQFWTVNGDGVTSPNGASSKIPPMQAFWVRANAGGGTLALTNAMRSHAPATDILLKAPAAKNTAKTLVRLQVSNGTNTDETVLYFNANASNGIDTYDAPKMSNDNVDIPEIYTTVGTEQLVINAMNTIPMDTPIGLGFIAGNATSFSLTANEISNLPADVKLILKDNVTTTETDLTDGVSTYQFSPAVTSSDRFSVIFRSAGAFTNVEAPLDNSLLVYSNAPQQLTVRCKDIYVGSILSVYNAIGQKLLSQDLTSINTQIAGKFTPGVYLVKVNNSTKKVIIN